MLVGRFHITPSSNQPFCQNTNTMAPTRQEKLSILLEKNRELTCRIKEAEEDKREETQTERQTLCRSLRTDRRELRAEFAQLILEEKGEKAQADYVRKKAEDQAKHEEKIARDLGLPGLAKKTLYNQLQRMNLANIEDH